MKAISNFLCVISLSVILFSCKKNDDAVATVTAPQTTLLSKAVYSAVGTYDYTYDSQNRMKTENYSGNASNPASFTTFTGYDSDGKLSSFNVHSPTGAFADNNCFNIYNSNGKLNKQFTYDLNGALTFTTAITYSGSVTTLKQYGSTGTLLSTTDYTLTPDGKNIAQFKTYNSAGTLLFTTVYSNYDAQRSTDALYPYGFGIAPNNQNNRQSLSRTNNSTGAVTNVAYTFQYNSDGYPVRSSGDNGSTIDYTYVKK